MPRKKKAKPEEAPVALTDTPGRDPEGHVRIRAKELIFVPASRLKPNPNNWHLHPARQAQALREVVDTVGFTTPPLVYQDGNDYILLDGELRTGISGDDVIPVILTDLDKKEADFVLATHDTVALDATFDKDVLRKLGGMLKGDQLLHQRLSSAVYNTGLWPHFYPEDYAKLIGEGQGKSDAAIIEEALGTRRVKVEKREIELSHENLVILETALGLFEGTLADFVLSCAKGFIGKEFTLGKKKGDYKKRTGKVSS